MDLFLREAADRIGADDVLTKINARMEWRLFSPILKRGWGRSGSGPQGYDPLVLFKCLLIGQWHGLSAPKLERALSPSLRVGANRVLIQVMKAGPSIGPSSSHGAVMPSWRRPPMKVIVFQ